MSKTSLHAAQLTLALEPELKHPAAGAVFGVHFVVTFLLEVSFVAALALEVIW